MLCSMQLKWNLIWHAQWSSKLAVLQAWWNLQDGIQIPATAQHWHISSFCFVPDSLCISAFLDERILHPLLEFQALAKFSKPSIVKFSWFALRVAKVRLLLLISAILVHDFSTLFWHTTIGTKSKVSRIKPIIRMAVFKNKLLDAVINSACYYDTEY